MYVGWKPGAAYDHTLQLLQRARAGFTQLIQEATQNATYVAEGLRLLVLPEEPARDQPMTPLQELKRRHAPWAITFGTERREDRLAWSGDLVACLGLITYAEQSVRDLRK